MCVVHWKAGSIDPSKSFDSEDGATGFEAFPGGFCCCLNPAVSHDVFMSPFQNGNIYSVPLYTESV